MIGSFKFKTIESEIKIEVYDSDILEEYKKIQINELFDSLDISHLRKIISDKILKMTGKFPFSTDAIYINIIDSEVDRITLRNAVSKIKKGRYDFHMDIDVL